MGKVLSQNPWVFSSDFVDRMEFRLHCIDSMVFVPMNVVLRHLSVDGHSRPVELLSCLADIPVGGDEDRKQGMPLVQGKISGIPETATELLGQVRKGDFLAETVAYCRL
jgi:hypothetical protein